MFTKKRKVHLKKTKLHPEKKENLLFQIFILFYLIKVNPRLQFLVKTVWAVWTNKNVLKLVVLSPKAYPGSENDDKFPKCFAGLTLKKYISHRLK